MFHSAVVFIVAPDYADQVPNCYDWLYLKPLTYIEFRFVVLFFRASILGYFSSVVHHLRQIQLSLFPIQSSASSQIRTDRFLK